MGGLTAIAAPVTPTFTTFGPLTGAQWSGSGNPNDPVAISTINDGGNTITLGLAAQQRYSNPALANDGNGTYFATAGANNGLSGSHGLGATWNFDFYFDATGGSYTYKLFYGLDSSSLISVNPALIGDNGATPHAGGGQNSQNLLFPAWGNLSSFVLNGLAFDPNASGIYSFELVAYNDAGAQVGSSAINVNVSRVPDTASTAGLLGLGIICLGLVQYRRTRMVRAK